MSAGVRLVRKVLNLHTFEKVPGAYTIIGPYQQIVSMEQTDPGLVTLFLLEDPSLQTRFDEKHAEWEKKAAEWDANPPPPGGKTTGTGLFANTHCLPEIRPVEPVLGGPSLVLMREGSEEPLLDVYRCDLTFLGKADRPDYDPHLYLFTSGKPLSPLNALFGGFPF